MILDTINVTPRALWRTIYCNCIFVIITIIEYRIKEPIAITCPSKKTITEIREFGILMIYNPALKFVEFICYFSVFLFSTNNWLYAWFLYISRKLETWFSVYQCVSKSFCQDIGNKEYSLKKEKNYRWYTHEHSLVSNQCLDIY